MIDIKLLQAAVMDSRDGITISDFSLPDNPLIFINPAFERMTGYLREEVIGKNCRYLQAGDSDQEGLLVLREALKNGQACIVKLRNYRKDGSMFWNELSMSPIFGRNGEITHFLGIQKDITNEMVLLERVLNENQELKTNTKVLERLVNMDPLTGLHNRRYFESQLDIQWKIASRQKQNLSVMMVDIDYFKKYNDTYGHQAGDAAIIAVARALNNAFMKSTDFVARYGGEEFIILCVDSSPERIAEYATTVVKRIFELHLEHSSSIHKHITVSIGFSSSIPTSDSGSGRLIKQADIALYKAKSNGRNRSEEYSSF